MLKKLTVRNPVFFKDFGRLDRVLSIIDFVQSGCQVHLIFDAEAESKNYQIIARTKAKRTGWKVVKWPANAKHLKVDFGNFSHSYNIILLRFLQSAYAHIETLEVKFLPHFTNNTQISQKMSTPFQNGWITNGIKANHLKSLVWKNLSSEAAPFVFIKHTDIIEKIQDIQIEELRVGELHAAVSTKCSDGDTTQD